MWSLIIGIVLGVAGLWLASWARAKNINIPWYAWLLLVLAVMALALMVMDLNAMAKQMEPTANGFIAGFYGIPALLLAVIAVALIWWQNTKKSVAAPKKG